MQFTSLEYLLFLGLSVAVYFALPGPRTRTLWLLAASYTFYFSLSARWTLALMAITAIGYAFGLVIAASGVGTPVHRKTKRLLAAGIVLVAGALFYFKYAAFSAGLLNSGLALAGVSWRSPALAIALPVGISFWTFQSIAYLVDVAKGTVSPERNPLRYALFIAFFPQVTAGPIARAGQLLPQLAEKRPFDYERMRSALVLMAWGFFKKLVVADPLGVVVHTVFSKPHDFGDNGIVLAGAAVAFAVQIYCDFSGYTDLARGAARLFGIDLMPNFARPYAARSIKEFWRRWHMTLMSWLKDYVYIPLGGSRVSKWRRYGNILAVFLFSGLWHGAGFTFIVWGLLNGLYQVLGELLEPARARMLALVRITRDGALHHALQVLTTFGLATIAWVFFRAESLSDALYILPRMFWLDPRPLLSGGIPDLGLAKAQLLVTAVAIVVVFGLEYLSARRDLTALLYRQHVAVRWAVYYGAALAILIFGYYGPMSTAADFAYFKF
ncbi:MAG: membrane-bound O-acyltransferase family protein [Actinobacteria bacterium HGW-Actinobacteria-1]|nr:MAG: membrane-bound O-acyltransferase family protein [Actinobacteria bacterium HGW-Actinobacteria-1]